MTITIPELESFRDEVHDVDWERWGWTIGISIASLITIFMLVILLLASASTEPEVRTETVPGPTVTVLKTRRVKPPVPIIKCKDIGWTAGSACPDGDPIEEWH